MNININMFFYLYVTFSTYSNVPFYTWIKHCLVGFRENKFHVEMRDIEIGR